MSYESAPRQVDVYAPTLRATSTKKSGARTAQPAKAVLALKGIVNRALVVAYGATPDYLGRILSLDPPMVV